MDKHTVQFDARGHCVKDKHLISVAKIIIVFKSNLDYFLFMSETETERETLDIYLVVERLSYFSFSLSASPL